MRFPVLFLIVCLALSSAAVADAGLLFGKSDCRPSCPPVVQQVPVDQTAPVSNAVNDNTTGCFGGRCLPRRQPEPQIPKAEVPPFEIPSADVDVDVSSELEPAPASDDVSILSLAAAAVGAVSAYFATREADADEDEPVAPDVV